jgi:hypothetical protein
MAEYADRGLNLALFFLRQGILQMRISEAEMGLILRVNRDQLSCGRRCQKKMLAVSGKEHFWGRIVLNERVKLWTKAWT